MDLSFHYLIMINQALFQKKALSYFFDMGLTPGQPKVLDYLSVHDGCIQKDIAFGCQIEPPTLTGIIKRMEEKGLLRRQVLNENKRSSYVFLTDKGRDRAEKVSKIFKSLEEEVFMDIEKEDAQLFMEVLYKICGNMTNVEELQ